jgi:hypothetical protein
VCLICSRRNEDLDSHCATCSRARGMTPTPRSGERPARLGGGGSAGGKSKGESHIAHTPQKQRRNRLYAALEAADDENHTREEMTAEIVGLELGALHKETVLKRKQWQGARADEAKWGRQIYSTRQVDKQSIWVDREQREVRQRSDSH